MKNSRHHFAKRAAKPDRTGPDGFVYDSKTEMLRGIELQLMQRAGEIKDLQRQPVYELKDEHITVMAGNRPARYTPDFEYFDIKSQTQIIEDVKGYQGETSKLRIRVFEAFYRKKITIVQKIRGKGWVFT